MNNLKHKSRSYWGSRTFHLSRSNEKDTERRTGCTSQAFG